MGIEESKRETRPGRGAWAGGAAATAARQQCSTGRRAGNSTLPGLWQQRHQQEQTHLAQEQLQQQGTLGKTRGTDLEAARAAEEEAEAARIAAEEAEKKRVEEEAARAAEEAERKQRRNVLKRKQHGQQMSTAVAPAATTGGMVQG